MTEEEVERAHDRAASEPPIRNDSCHPEDPGQDYIDCPHCGAGRIYSIECDCCGWKKGDPAPERRRRR